MSEGPPKKKSTEAPKVPERAGGYETVFSSGKAANIDVLNVPTLSLSDVVEVLGINDKIHALPELTDVAPGSETVDILLPDAESVPPEGVRPIVLKALSMLFKKVEVSPDGKRIILLRKDDSIRGKASQQFEISVEDASRMVSLEAERIRLQKATESTFNPNPDYVDTVPPALPPEVPQGPSLSDPMIQRSLHHAKRINNSQLGKLNKEIVNRVRREKEESETVAPHSEVADGEVVNSENTFFESEISNSAIDGMYTAETGIGFEGSPVEVPKTIGKPNNEGTQSEKMSATTGDGELISQYEAALRRLGLEEKNKIARAVRESKETKIPSSYEAALRRYPNTSPKRDTAPEVQSSASAAPESLAQESRVLSRDEVAKGAKKFKEMQSILKQRSAEDLNKNETTSGVTVEGVKKLDIDLSETGGKVDIELPPVSLRKESTPVLTDVVPPENVGIERPREPKGNEVAVEGQRGEKLELLDYLVRAEEIRKQKRRDAGLDAPNFFDERFEKNFGISYEEIGEIDGFTKLSSGQQVLVYENLKEYAEQGDKGYLGAVWSGIKNAVGNKKEAVVRKGTRGIDAYRDVLDTLIYAARTGPKVHMENGVAIPDFVGMGYKQAYRKEQYALNIAAREFARVPIDWQEGKSTSKAVTFLKERIFRLESQKNLRTYEAIQKAFEKAKRVFAQQLEAAGVPPEQIVRTLIEVDGQIHMLRFIETNPEAVALLRNIKDDDLWKSVGETLASRSLDSEFGSVSRAATVEALKSMSGPLVATARAAAERWSPTAAAQRKRDRGTQAGDILTDTRRSMAAREGVKTPEGLKDMGVTAELSRLTEQFSTFPPEEKCTNEQKTKRNRLLSQLKKLVSFSYDELKLKHIQFGSDADAVLNKTKFIETLARAQIILALEESHTKAPASESESRLRRYGRKFTLAVSLAGAATLAGVFAVDEIKTGETTGKLKNWFTSVKVKSDSPSFETGSITVVPSLKKSLHQNQLDSQVEHANVEPLEKLEPLPVEENLSSVKDIPELKEISVVQSAPVEAEVVAQTTEAQSVPQSSTASEKAEILKQFSVKPSVASGPQSPTKAEVAEMQRLFSVPATPELSTPAEVAGVQKLSVEKLPNPNPVEIARGGMLRDLFLKTNVPEYTWDRIRRIPVESFVLSTMERGGERTPALVQLGKIFYEVTKPPYNVTMHRSDSTEIFAKQAFTAISQAHSRGLSTDSMRELLGSVKGTGNK